MKTKGSFTWLYLLLVAVAFSWTACSNFQKKKEKAMEQKKTDQPLDTVIYIESETTITMDSIAQDSTKRKQDTVAVKKQDNNKK